MRMLRKAVLTAVVMLLVAAGVCGCSSKKVSFEKRKGAAGVDVYVLNVPNDYADKDSGTYEVEIPVALYNAIDKQLQILDSYMSNDDEKVRKADEKDLRAMSEALHGLMEFDFDYAGEDSDALEKWADASWEDTSENAEAYVKYNVCYDFMKKFKKSVETVESYLGMVRMGYASSALNEKATDKDMMIFYPILDFFPSVKLSSLGLKR